MEKIPLCVVGCGGMGHRHILAYKELDDSGIGWCRDLWKAMGQYATGEAYINFMTEEEGERLETAYGPSFQRLVELKNRYDPTNLFRLNQNIRPKVMTA